MDFLHKIEKAAKHVAQDAVHEAEGVGHTVANLGREAEHYGEAALRALGRTLIPGSTEDVQLSHSAHEIMDREHVHNARDLHGSADRSALAWDALKTNMGGTRGLTDSRDGNPASAWTWGQTMVAALDQAKLTGNYEDFENLSQGLEQYKSPRGGYAPGSNGVHGTGNRYYDDNAWIGLAYMQAYDQTKNPTYLHNAKDVFKFLQTGVQPDGGLRWEENHPKRSCNTCDMGPAMELALRLHMDTAHHPHDTSDPYFQFANRLHGYLDSRLRIQSGPNAGLYGDNVDGQGHVDDTVRSYNQGTPIGANVLFYKATGDPKYLHEAQATADASLAYYGPGDHLMKQPPAFNAIYLRNLMQLDAVAPDPRYRELMTHYTNNVWQQSLNPESGLFDAPASQMGHYGGGPGHISALDQAALVQLLSLDAFSAKDESIIT